MKNRILTMLAIAILLVSTTAMASPMSPITGEINFTGSLSLVGGTNLSNSTGIDFIAGTTGVSQTVSGIYSLIPTPPPLANVTEAVFKDFTYSPFTAVLELWKVVDGSNEFTFDLLSISSVTDTKLTGLGMLHATGYEDTKGTFFLTTQGGTGALGFSATSAVPEPGTLLLLGSGLIGLAYLKRRKS